MSLVNPTPGGAQTRSKAAGVWGKERYASYAVGSQVVVEGREYTDWIAALAAVGLGYGAVQANRTILPLPSMLEQDAAQALLDVLPQVGWDQVRWVTTGSEATLGAMMIARRATGRRKVISVGYHGWHEAHLASRDLVALPIESREAAIRAIDGDTAAVLWEVVRNVRPTFHRPGEFIETDDVTTIEWDPFGKMAVAMQAKCKEQGALLIVDEIVTGFRYALGGATELYQLKPDLAVYGKAMSNGFPIAAIVGHHSLMKHAVEISGTYNGWPPALSAVLDTIRLYQEEGVVSHMYSLGQRLLDQCSMLTGWPCHPVFKAGKDYTTSDAALQWVEKAEARGHLLHPAGLNIMLAHTKDDVDALSAALNS